MATLGFNGFCRPRRRLLSTESGRDAGHWIMVMCINHGRWISNGLLHLPLMGLLPDMKAAEEEVGGVNGKAEEARSARRCRHDGRPGSFDPALAIVVVEADGLGKTRRSDDAAREVTSPTTKEMELSLHAAASDDVLRPHRIWDRLVVVDKMDDLDHSVEDEDDGGCRCRDGGGIVVACWELSDLEGFVDAVDLSGFNP
ncbi:hypothetical protein ACLOJK_034881 [Asimina triloba]